MEEGRCLSLSGILGPFVGLIYRQICQNATILEKESIFGTFGTTVDVNIRNKVI